MAMNIDVPKGDEMLVRLRFTGDAGQEYYENAMEWTWNKAKNEVLTNEVAWTWNRAKTESTKTWNWANAKNESVAYSVQLEPLVIADYAGDGSVRGIEVLGRQTRSEDYVNLAVKMGRGPVAGGADFGGISSPTGGILPYIRGAGH